MSRRKVTNPTQAASKTTINRWQAELARLSQRIAKLYHSMGKAQRR